MIEFSLMFLEAHRLWRIEFRISNIFQVRLPKKTNNKYSKFDRSKSMSYQRHKSKKFGHSFRKYSKANLPSLSPNFSQLNKGGKLLKIIWLLWRRCSLFGDSLFGNGFVKVLHDCSSGMYLTALLLLKIFLKDFVGLVRLFNNALFYIGSLLLNHIDKHFVPLPQNVFQVQYHVFIDIWSYIH